MNEPENNRDAVMAYTADITAAFVSHNTVSPTDLPSLISAVSEAMTRLLAPVAGPQAEKPVPAVPIKKSVTPEAIYSLEDGKPYKSLKRHLARRGLTPADYRAKWGLPSDYPMTAPAYSAKRSELAKALGLGQQRRKREPAPEVKAPRRRRAA